VAHRGSPAVNPVFLSIAQVAARLGISRAHCYRLATRGLLPVLELGRRKVVPVEWLQRWLDDRYEDLAGSETASAE
jgi:excisionase family DNA binding protein